MLDLRTWGDETRVTDLTCDLITVYVLDVWYMLCSTLPPTMTICFSVMPHFVLSFTRDDLLALEWYYRGKTCTKVEFYVTAFISYKPQ